MRTRHEAAGHELLPLLIRILAQEPVRFPLHRRRSYASLQRLQVPADVQQQASARGNIELLGYANPAGGSFSDFRSLRRSISGRRVRSRCFKTSRSKTK